MGVYARTTTVRGRPQALDEGIAQVRDEVMPAVQEMDGCVGLSMLVDRESGTCIVTTAWDSEQSLRASREKVRSLRDRASETLGGEPSIQEWEIAILHRERPAGEGAWARVTWLQMDPASIDEQVETFRSRVLPKVGEIDGFCSVSLVVDRETGRASTAATYESREALERSREIAKTLRDEGTRDTGAEVYDIAELELVLAHLRVPETV